MTRAAIPFLDLTTGTESIRADLDLVWKTVTDHGRYVNGPEVMQFEHAFAEYCGAAHCVGVGNGTDALELILAGLGIGPGDEVVVPANTFVATAEAVLAVGARPRFVDVHPDSLLIDPDAAAAAVNSATAAVVAVHLYGQMTEPGPLLDLVHRYGLALVEDSAQAHGARHGGRRAGSVGHAAGFSFYPGKNLGAFGDGGAVVTSDPALADRVRCLADHGRDPHERHRHVLSGRNSRLDTLQAAILSVRLGRLDDDNRRRRDAVGRYRDELPSTVVPVAQHPDAESVHHLAVVQLDDREAAVAALDRAGIGWGLHYPVPCHRQPPFADSTVDAPVVEAAADRILSLPLSPSMTADQVSRTCEVLSASLTKDKP
ncbi:dTDP-4-amino-4,6-dideoxygalactose transaminase [Pseudonocardia sediminis]|uniref:dTDP-4-amino-4,6-dideoxygalactose transaminase n=1 Tax=Pseudonocardia sediminis TaxID=1397368 RepID=A0A4V2FRA7_PSEST|nr:DegT/DnrJ/EryC1/StrS family aminotransferase [Pseudonocardia sediminis]RZT87880.1 dTDP-4-amino-4,6-dideoxygalactose transaminase [Pseudonocardia sediminis]